MCRVTQWFCSEEFLAQHNIQYEGRQGSVPVFAGSQPSAKLCRVGEAERRIAGSEPSAGPCRFAERRISGSQPSTGAGARRRMDEDAGARTSRSEFMSQPS